jgi:thioredoxin 1
MKFLCILGCAFFAFAAAAAEMAYNDAADAKLDIKQALAQAVTNNKPVIVVFGANWCGDCKALSHALKSGASAPLMKQDFEIVKVSVGNPIDGHLVKNLDLAQTYGVPLEKGIPAVAILSTNNEVLYATRAGELADAEKMGDAGIYEFFKRVTVASALKK